MPFHPLHVLLMILGSLCIRPASALRVFCDPAAVAEVHASAGGEEPPVWTRRFNGRFLAISQIKMEHFDHPQPGQGSADLVGGRRPHRLTFNLDFSPDARSCVSGIDGSVRAAICHAECTTVRPLAPGFLRERETLKQAPTSYVHGYDPRENIRRGPAATLADLAARRYRISS
jgi:hypothetical protein